MEIKKFEAYTYRGPGLMNMNREQIIEQIIDNLTDAKIGDYECNGTSYYSATGELWLHCDKKVGDKYVDFKIIKLDMSDMGIEIGTAEWNDDEEEYEDFIPEVNLDTDMTKQIKSYKKDIKGYNL